jgi:hypothetical protein
MRKSREGEERTKMRGKEKRERRERKVNNEVRPGKN